jgi:hypothetical protein
MLVLVQAKRVEFLEELEADDSRELTLEGSLLHIDTN